MIQVLVGATVPERDVTEVIDDLAYSSAAPGGFASCSFTIPGRALHRYVNQLRHDARVWVKRGTKTVWEGYVVNDPEAVKFGDSADVVVECGGLLEVAKRRQDYCKTWTDSDFTQWLPMQPNGWATFTADTDDRLYIVTEQGVTTQDGYGASLYYWIDSGLGGDDISHIVLSGTHSIGSAYDANIQYSTTPWAGWTDSDFAATTDGTPVSDFRDPESGSYPAGTRAVRVKFWCFDGPATAAADRYINISEMTVYRASAAQTIDQAMVDVADDTGLATTTTSSTIGSGRDIAVRPFATRAEALEYIGSLHESPVEWGFWDDATFSVAERATTPAVTDHLIVDASDPGVTWDVERLAEDACDAVCVLYGAGIGSTYPVGTTTAVYRPATPATDADVRVHVLDYSSVVLSDTQAQSVGDQYMGYVGGTQYEGTVTVTGSVKRVDGVPVPACELRAGMWVENLDEHGHAPRYVSFCDYSRDTDTATLTIGDPRREFAGSERIGSPVVSPIRDRKSD